ncbi:hypothetical protein [Zobellella sp. DQSA1]|uniref:hypothetical protein n=1 Tax=Zobellella sp. DQSA1 TaxID=3342386 RepID=UPI0035BF3B29
MSLSNLVSLLLGSVAIGVAVLSWRVTYIQGRKLASRNETFVHVTSVHQLADQLDSLAEQHWLAAAEDRSSYAYEQKVLAKIKLLGFKFSALEERGIVIDQKHALTIRRSMTGATKSASDSAILKSTFAATNSLRAAADQAYWRKYPHT